ncbi:hypothetical protein FBZ89_12454 [Nitrospirillum amazonense]|uniref:Core-binding (CB) domain-containing protein n=1 Tax=Nitrospirillum amazonense TaxID=28077 RepID=A0A560ESU1_9PROT|nr:hypothetical protein [Nitrospirillum amazonense]TWB12441.1 hypothetical protein FBZ89_12454 [Nitrospirillum amazonense]
MIEHDEICLRRLSGLTPQDIANFRDRMLAADYAPATVVRRMNLIATAIAHGRREWSIHLPSNPAEAKLTARPKGADRKRERRLAPERTEIIPAFFLMRASPPAATPARLVVVSISSMRREAVHPKGKPMRQPSYLSALRRAGGERCQKRHPEPDGDARRSIPDILP